MERLPVRMLLLHAILASDLQGAEKKSSIPRRLLSTGLLHSQIHCSDLPAGGALGLDASGKLSFPDGRKSGFNHTSFGLQGHNTQKSSLFKLFKLYLNSFCFFYTVWILYSKKMFSLVEVSLINITCEYVA